MIGSLVLSVLFQAVAPSATPPAPPILQTLTLGNDSRACTADAAWCVGLVQGAPRVEEGVQAETGVATEPVIRPVVRQRGEALPEAPQTDNLERESYQPWTGLVRLADGGFLAGVEAGSTAMYSGGGGQASELRLFRLNSDGEAGSAPVLIVPLNGSVLIRACFSDKDMTQRAGACHDDYNFEAKLTLTPGVSDVMPAFNYVATATAYPRGVNRNRDSLAMRPLTARDLVIQRDPDCSYHRRFTYDSTTGVYQPEKPLPDCTAYTVP